MYGLGAAAAIAIVGAGVWYLSQVDEYEEARKKIAGISELKTLVHPIYGEVVELDAFVELTSIIKTEQLRKKREQLESEGLSQQYPLERRRELYKGALKSQNWEEYDKFVIKHEAAEELITAETVREIAAICGISEQVINNTT